MDRGSSKAGKSFVRYVRVGVSFYVFSYYAYSIRLFCLFVFRTAIKLAVDVLPTPGVPVINTLGRCRCGPSSLIMCVKFLERWEKGRDEWKQYCCCRTVEWRRRSCRRSAKVVENCVLLAFRWSRSGPEYLSRFAEDFLFYKRTHTQHW